MNTPIFMNRVGQTQAVSWEAAVYDWEPEDADDIISYFFDSRAGASCEIPILLLGERERLEEGRTRCDTAH
ncbi:hypothetical protein GCM10008090_34790 [Arenicella chitinivorans]|uniref:Uncharacterized protein n=1 Tax=Arenicella chitinivorans TaxID=1329800 RepID=A0A918VTK0_9GAMM|nr:hypothetical protein GCM10008090_34790 [Arenicella chitinivorans]